MDPIADMLIRIKNSQAVGKETAVIGYSKMIWGIAKVLERLGYLGSVVRKGKKSKKLIEVKLIYNEDRSPKVSGARRISKLSRRVYKGTREIYTVKNGFGVAIYSTPKGLLTDSEARKEKVGGEILFKIW